MTQAAAAALDPRAVLEADARSKEPFVLKRLLGYCWRLTHDMQRARDTMSDAITKTLAGEGWHRWKHDDGRPAAESLLLHLRDVARDCAKVDRERAANWREIEGDPERDAAAADPGAAVGEKPVEWAKHDEQMQRAEAVMARLDEDARRMLRVESESEQELDAKTLAEKLGWTTKDVYRARERVAHHRDAVLAMAAKRRGGAS